MNKVFLIGRLTRDPELRYTSSNIAAATFTVAVNRNFTNQNGERDADFINVIAWRKTAENIKNYLSKGSQIAIDGRIQTRSYDAQDGTKRYVTEVLADNVQFLDRATPNNGGNNNYSNNNNSPFGAPSFNQAAPSAPQFNDNASPYDFASSAPSTSIPANDPFSEFGSSIEISDDDLPF